MLRLLGGGLLGVKATRWWATTGPTWLWICFCPERLTISPFVRRRETTIYLFGYSKDVNRTKCQALTIIRLTHSPYTTEIARIRCYTRLSTIYKCQDVHIYIDEPVMFI